MGMVRVVLAVAFAALLTAAPAIAAPSGTAPGGPGAPALWTPADKDGYGTATTTTSRVWHTISDGELTEVFYPDLGTPSIRDTQLVVSGGSFTDYERTDTSHKVELADSKSLTYRQINTDLDGDYRITKTYATDPARNVLLVDVRFESLSGDPYTVRVLHDPALTNDGSDRGAHA
jgi:glucoamylase